MSVALLNLYIAVELLVASTSLKYNYICEPCRQKYSQDELRVSRTTSRLSECLLNQNRVSTGDERSLVVLLLEVHRILRQFLLHPAKEGQPADLPACLPPQHHVPAVVDRRQVGAEWLE